jgi:hypothetical protein
MSDVEFKVKTVHMPAAVEPDRAVRVGIPVMSCVEQWR